MTLCTGMPSISQGAKALEMAPSFRESKPEEEQGINSRRGEGTVRAGNRLRPTGQTNWFAGKMD